MTHSSNSSTLPNSEHPENGYVHNPKIIELDDRLPNREAEEAWSHSTRDLLDTLPRVWTRGFLYLIVLFSAIVIPWAMLSKVDETGTARGRLEPKGKTNRIDSPASGKVSALKVKEGQQVKAGQVLMELESEVPRSEMQQAMTRLEGQRNRLIQLQAIKTQLESAIKTQHLQNRAQLAAQMAQITQIRQQVQATESQLTLTQELLAKDNERSDRFRKFRDEGIIPGVQVEDAERNSIETQQRAEKVQADLEQSKSELQKQQSSYDKAVQDGALTILDSHRRLKEIDVQIASAQSEIAESQKQLEALQYQLQERVVRSPISGTIFQLLAKNPGSVLQSGSAIAEIAPKNMSYVLRAEMPSQESGFLRVGMPVKVKFDAYPFQDYGVVSGRVQSISPDSKIKETPQGSIEVFELSIVLDHPYLQSGDRKITLTPGQAATAEVIVRQRRVMDYVLDPFKKLQAGGIKL